MVEARSTSEAVERRCPVCGSGEAAEFLRKQKLQLRCCRLCSMIYASPVAAEYVSGRYYDREAAGYYLSPAKLESDYADVRFERELRLFRKHCRSGKVLDVGCSSGAFLYQLKKRFPGAYEIVGTDASGPALDYAEKQGVAAVRGDFLSGNLERSMFDALTFWAVLEHVAEPGMFLDRAHELLRAGGFCFVLVPNFRSLATGILGARYRYIYPQHLNYFSRATLEKLVRRRLEVVEVRSTHFNPVVIWQDWRRAGADVSNEDRAALLQKTTKYKQDPLLKPVKAFYRLGEAVLGTLGLADNLAMVLKKAG